MGKDVYYKNILLFIQRLQCLVTFKRAAFVKANITTSFQGSALKWYISELSNFDHNTLNNNPGMKSWINTFFYCFKVLTSIALDLLTNKTYSFDNACTQRSSAEYVCAIMRHGIGCNIIDIANQLSFACRGLAPELQVFVMPQPNLPKHLISYTPSIRSKRFGTKWWPPQPLLINITIQLKSCHFSLLDLYFQVNLRLFCVTSFSNTYPKPSYPGKTPSVFLIRYSQPCLLDLSVSTSLNIFVKHLRHNVNNTM